MAMLLCLTRVTWRYASGRNGFLGQVGLAPFAGRSPVG